jgi:hypothetical protein
MSAGSLAKLASAKLPELLPHLEAADPVKAALAACATTPEALELLVGRNLLSEAVKLLALAMPRREAVRCSCGPTTRRMSS